MKANEFNTNYYKEEKKIKATKSRSIARKIKLKNYNISFSVQN